ncbi:MAG: hypothetical protein IPK06_02220 [Ignavibacteriae bacterium]|nr:hypothetical protein [Ignavibacteriota bacterium]
MEHTIYTAKDNEKEKNKECVCFYVTLAVLYRSIAAFSVVYYFPKVPEISTMNY